MLTSLLSALIAPTRTLAQPASFPSKPIRIVVPYAGGLADEEPRFYAQLITKTTGHAVFIDNRPGGSGIVGAQVVKAAPADGYTLLMGAMSPMVVNPVVMKDLPYDPFKDFRPVHGLVQSPGAFVVRADSPYRSIRDVIERAMREDRPINIGNYSVMYELIASWLGLESKIKFNHIRYKGGGPMITDLLGGQLELCMNEFASTATLIEAGKVRALAVTSTSRYAAHPGVPTMVESGFPGFVSYGFASIFTRAEVPDVIVSKLAEMFTSAMQTPEAKERYRARVGTEALPLGPQQMGELHRKDYERFKRIADTTGIKIDY